MSLNLQNVLSDIQSGKGFSDVAANSGLFSSSGAAAGAAIGSIIPGVGTAIGGLVGGLAGLFTGTSYWQARYDKMNALSSSADDICKAYIVCISNGTFNNNDFNQFQEMFGYKAPQQGHGWADRTGEVKYTTMAAFNLLGQQKGVPSDWLFPQSIVNALALTVKPTLKDDFNTKPTQSQNEPVNASNEPQNIQEKKTFWSNFSFKQTSATPYLFWTLAIAVVSAIGYLIKKAFFNNNKKR